MWICQWQIVCLLLVAFYGPLASCDGEDSTGDDSLVEDGQRISFSLINHFLWELTKDTRSQSPANDIIAQWVAAISEVVGVTINCSEIVSRIILNKANNLKRKVKSLKGGRQRATYLDTEWTFLVPQCDIKKIKDIQKENSFLKKQVTELKKAMETRPVLVETQNSSTGHARKRSIEEYSQRHQSRLKKQRQGSCSSSLSWLTEDGLQPLEVVVLNTKTSQKETIRLSNIAEVLNVEEEPESEELDMVNIMLYIKDRYSISGAAYHEMAKLCNEMPRHHKLKAKIAHLNELWDIRPTPNGVMGVQQSLEVRLQKRIKHLESTTPSDAPFKKDKVVRVKLSGDGTTIGKRLHVINFTFTVLDEGSKAHSCEGNHSLAIFRDKESYESLQNALQDIINEARTLTVIEVDSDRKYNVRYYLGGDWKFLALVTGFATGKEAFRPEISYDFVISSKNDSSQFQQRHGDNLAIAANIISIEIPRQQLHVTPWPRPLKCVHN